jgi:hypothetical protein
MRAVNVMSDSEHIEEIRAHQRIWQGVHDKATAALDAFGAKDYRGRADYWIVDDDWGPDLLQVEINNPRMLRRDAIGALKRVLDAYPQWQIIVRVFSRKDEAALPPMGPFLTLLVIEFDADILKASLPAVWSRTGFMMARSEIQAVSVPELVERFVSIGLAQYDALYVADTNKFNRLYREMEDVRNELKRREGDQRRALLPLLDHPNLQVRMMAAHAVLAITPALARKAFESVRESGIFPQAMDAGMTLSALENGTFVPS